MGALPEGKTVRNRRRTIAALRRLAERPGTPHEGIVAKIMLERMAGNSPQPKPFRLADFPLGTAVFYNYWAYPQNDPCTIAAGRRGVLHQTCAGQTWMRLRFNHLKQPRWVPVTSVKGSHISKEPLSEADAKYLHMPHETDFDVDEWIQDLRSRGVI